MKLDRLRLLNEFEKGSQGIRPCGNWASRSLFTWASWTMGILTSLHMQGVYVVRQQGIPQSQGGLRHSERRFRISEIA